MFIGWNSWNRLPRSNIPRTNWVWQKQKGLCSWIHGYNPGTWWCWNQIPSYWGEILKHLIRFGMHTNWKYQEIFGLMIIFQDIFQSQPRFFSECYWNEISGTWKSKRRSCDGWIYLAFLLQRHPSRLLSSWQSWYCLLTRCSWCDFSSFFRLWKKISCPM